MLSRGKYLVSLVNQKLVNADKDTRTLQLLDLPAYESSKGTSLDERQKLSGNFELGIPDNLM